MANTVEIHVKAKDSASRVLGGVGKAFSGLRKNVGEAIKPIAEMGLKLATIGSTAVSAAPLLVPVAKAVFSVGQAAVQASPALLSFAAAGIFVKATLGEIFKKGSAAREAIQPLADRFHQAGDAASRAAAKGVRPLIDQFNKLNMPHVEAAMVRIGNATNKVTTGFLKWANSTKGVRAIQGIVDPIGRSMEQLAPHITKVTTSFVAMLGRITGVSMAAGTSGLSKVLDHLASIMDKVDKSSVGGGINKLVSTFNTVRHVASEAAKWVGKAVDLYKTYQTKFKYLADAIAVAAIAFGGPVTIIIAVIGLIIRHFDQLKAAYGKVKDYFKSPIGKGVFNDLADAAKTLLPSIKKAFQGIAHDVGPTLSEIGHKITNDLIPAFADFMKEAAPVAAWIIEKFGPIIGQNLKGTFEVISGLITMLSGLFKIASGILSGDWGKIWDGLKDAFGKEGIGKIIQGGLRASFAPVIPLLKSTGNKIKEAWHTITGSLSSGWDKLASGAGKVKDAVSDVAGWIGKLKGKTVKIAQSGASAAKSAISSVVSTIRKYAGKTVHIAQSGASTAKNAVQSVISTIRRFAGKVVHIGESGAAAAMHRVSSLISSIRRLFGKVVRVGANVFGLGAVQGLISAIHNVVSKTVSVGAKIFGFAHGGVIGAAGGGPRSNLTLVGEQGPELVRLPAGSSVTPNGQTRQMLAQGGQELKLLLEWVGTNGGDGLIAWLRENIRIKAGTGDGNVQKALG